MWTASPELVQGLRVPGPRVIHDCPADGSEHENSAQCVCGPTREPDDADGNQHWRHH